MASASCWSRRLVVDEHLDPILCMGVSAAYGGAGWPMFNVLSAEPDKWVVYLASFTSIGLSFLIVWMCTIATGHRDFRIAEKAAAKEQTMVDGQRNSLTPAGV
ncbi:hypothetical protein [Sporichthya sp.]|uniref:hypothetical protein n=1 Tax=Sporichthya sp. TaxID=65475 RepID=UPI0017970324|nr:hypothetical protein [Sporichthya sp.]MBA3741533.1 hypothetical protein [Sporichthya sp.]